jgi:hypothetical protein
MNTAMNLRAAWRVAFIFGLLNSYLGGKGKVVPVLN